MDCVFLRTRVCSSSSSQRIQPAPDFGNKGKSKGVSTEYEAQRGVRTRPIVRSNMASDFPRLSQIAANSLSVVDL